MALNSPWHSRGQGFDPPRLHQMKKQQPCRFSDLYGCFLSVLDSLPDLPCCITKNMIKKNKISFI